jgi:hypothetical protein
MTDRKLMQHALEALEWHENAWSAYRYAPAEISQTTITALRERLAQPNAYGYASRLAVAIWEQHYKDVAPQWKPLDDLLGVLTQIDNMTSGLTRLAQPQMQPCAGRNCGSTNPNLHSAECFEDYEKSTGMAQPEQEPVAWMYHGIRHDDTPHERPSLIWKPEYMDVMSAEKGAKATPLYTTPRQWQGLTADEIWACNVAPAGHSVTYHISMANQNVLDFAEAIEAKLKEKNT